MVCANLSCLAHELRERIASTSPKHHGDDDALETRFRAVLPNLLHAYVVPSSSGLSLSLSLNSLSPLFLQFHVVYTCIFIDNRIHSCFSLCAAKEREVIAVLKLLTHTAKNFPGVFLPREACSSSTSYRSHIAVFCRTCIFAMWSRKDFSLLSSFPCTGIWLCVVSKCDGSCVK